MNNQTANVDFYLGALGPHGFCGYFDRLCHEPGRQMYLIKSGPGCGKSTMMRKIAEASPFPVQRIHCSSDPDSLDAERLFERFYQGNAARGGGGSGLGLAIVAQLARALRIDVSARLDGDVLTVELAFPNDADLDGAGQGQRHKAHEPR